MSLIKKYDIIFIIKKLIITEIDTYFSVHPINVCEIDGAGMKEKLVNELVVGDKVVGSEEREKG